MRPEGPGTEPALLLVEDSAFDARLIGDQLRASASLPYTIRHVSALAAAKAELSAGTFDCVLLDLSLPDATHLQGVDDLIASFPDVPVVVLSGTDEAVIGAHAVQAGAQDYLTKGDTDGRQLWRSIRYAIERKHSELLLRHQALHDPLTGLPNRVLFIDRLEVALTRLTRRPGRVCVMFLDLDGFKWVNDSLGHDAGDLVVAEVACRIAASLRVYDTAARVGGDEFLILAESPADEGEEGTVILAERIREALALPYHVAGSEVRISVSIGITGTQEAGTSAATLIRDADAAMYKAKDLGKNRHAFFNDSMRQQAEHRVRLLTDLHLALENNEFLVLYQPIVDLRDRHVRGWEALLRWRRPNGALVSPAEFIELLEDHGLIVPVGQIVLEKACSWLAQRHAELPACAVLPTVSVNMSALQLTQTGIVDRVAGVIKASGLQARYITLELTESQLVSEDPGVRARLDALKDLGLRLSMDDYGTGFSTLVQLKRLPFDVLKIDQSFVATMADSESDLRIVQAVIAMGESLGLGVIAEGVETEEQARLLSQAGCILGQGYLFGRPSPEGTLGS